MYGAFHLGPRPWAVLNLHQLSSKLLRCLVLSITPLSKALAREPGKMKLHCNLSEPVLVYLLPFLMRL